jgi:hypothetical protein
MQKNTPFLAAKILGEYANHFEIEDWKYTRNLGNLRKIDYDNESNSLLSRVKTAISYLRGDVDNVMYFLDNNPPSWSKRWGMAKFALTYHDRHLPDGSLDKGSILTFWEETGEYIQLVQPSVGALLAEFLLDEPDNPHAKKISAEILRIIEDYEARLKEASDG